MAQVVSTQTVSYRQRWKVDLRPGCWALPCSRLLKLEACDYREALLLQLNERFSMSFKVWIQINTALSGEWNDCARWRSSSIFLDDFRAKQKEEIIRKSIKKLLIDSASFTDHSTRSFTWWLELISAGRKSSDRSLKPLIYPPNDINFFLFYQFILAQSSEDAVILQFYANIWESSSGFFLLFYSHTQISRFYGFIPVLICGELIFLMHFTRTIIGFYCAKDDQEINVQAIFLKWKCVTCVEVDKEDCFNCQKEKLQNEWK